MAVPSDVAAALVAWLNTGTYTTAFTAAQDYRPREELEGLSTLSVTVTPSALSVEYETRRDDRETVGVDVTVAKQLANADVATVDPLLNLCQEIRDRVRGVRLPTNPGATANGVLVSPLYSVERLNDLLGFFCTMTFTFSVGRRPS